MCTPHSLTHLFLLITLHISTKTLTLGHFHSLLCPTTWTVNVSCKKKKKSHNPEDFCHSASMFNKFSFALVPLDHSSNCLDQQPPAFFPKLLFQSFNGLLKSSSHIFLPSLSWGLIALLKKKKIKAITTCLNIPITDLSIFTTISIFRKWLISRLFQGQSLYLSSWLQSSACSVTDPFSLICLIFPSLVVPSLSP